MTKGFIPAFFSKIGKGNKDELDKKKYYLDRQVEIKTKTAGGVALTSDTKLTETKAVSSLKAEFDVFEKNAKVEVEATTERLKLFSITSDKLLDGLKLQLKAEADQRDKMIDSAKESTEVLESSLDAQYKVSNFTFATLFKTEMYNAGNKSYTDFDVTPSLTVGSDGFSVGGEVRLDATGKLEDYNVGAQYDYSDSSFHLKTEKRLKTYKFGVLHKVSPFVKFSTLYGFTVAEHDKKAKHSLEAGLWQDLGRDSEIREKLVVTSDNTADLFASYSARLNENARLTLGTSLDLLHLHSRDPKFGFKLQLGDA